jgi:hypothetical protein
MANGWTPERRAKQSTMIQNWKPWRKSTGAKTEKGKIISSQNSKTHGEYTEENREIQTLISSLISHSKGLNKKFKI